MLDNIIYPVIFKFKISLTDMLKAKDGDLFYF